MNDDLKILKLLTIEIGGNIQMELKYNNKMEWNLIVMAIEIAG